MSSYFSKSFLPPSGSHVGSQYEHRSTSSGEEYGENMIEQAIALSGGPWVPGHMSKLQLAQ